VLDALLDRSIVFSFDRTGYRRHARRFDPADLDVDGRGRVALVTGASSGLGVEIARGLLARGLSVVMACRDVAKGERVRSTLPNSEHARVARLDVGSLAEVRAFAEGWSGPLDVLVHNAGALLDRPVRTREGLEETVAVHLVGPFLMTHLFASRLASSPDARIVHVASGGMYGAKLDVERLFAWPERGFDGVAQYAHAKRAQVIVAAELARRSAGPAFTAMHPGWADTPGVRTSLPRFFALTRAILRTPAEGADTALFLALAARARGASGFWFDRAPAPLHLGHRTAETAAERARLWSTLVERAGVPEGAFS
jgi:NAD(P)-dependent dehydrogenase (short-subunit alcohol dehydrogenase family)